MLAAAMHSTLPSRLAMKVNGVGPNDPFARVKGLDHDSIDASSYGSRPGTRILD